MLSALQGADSITFTGLSESWLTPAGVTHRIEAEKHILHIPRHLKLSFLTNKRDIVKQKAYYEKGRFYKEKAIVQFTKAYWLEGKFYMYGCSGTLPQHDFQAKEAVFDGQSISFKQIRYTQNQRHFSRYKYLYRF